MKTDNVDNHVEIQEYEIYFRYRHAKMKGPMDFSCFSAKVHSFQVSPGIFYFVKDIWLPEVLICILFQPIAEALANILKSKTRSAHAQDHYFFIWSSLDSSTNQIHFKHGQILQTVSSNSRLSFLRFRSCLPCIKI